MRKRRLLFALLLCSVMSLGYLGWLVRLEHGHIWSALIQLDRNSYRNILGFSNPAPFLSEDNSTKSNSVATSPQLTQNVPVLTVDRNAKRRPINPDIYGINFAKESLVAELDISVRRWGGNATTRFNWQNDTANRASDWFFENIPMENPDAHLLPYGSATDKFVEQDQRTGTKSILTIPLIGWTPKSREVACGFSRVTYGEQQNTDPYRPDCGNGITTSGYPIVENDPTDTSVVIDPTFVQRWIQHLVERFGTADEGGVAYYALDNEPMLWHHTHRDVHPEPVSYNELHERSVQYASVVKEIDPSAQTLGPVLWGWTAYFQSAKDQLSNSWRNRSDQRSHDGLPLVPWYLQEMRIYEEKHGIRILDYLDLHYYPQGKGVALSPVGNANTQALRLRSTRALWDPLYVDESWINEPIYLIPRMRKWVDDFYPSTKLALTEYNWGAVDDMNGAIAQADILGIFGREGLDLATLWALGKSDVPATYAFRIYRNYDGNGSTFGDISIYAASTNQDVLAIYAAERSTDKAVTLMVINKSAATLRSQVELAGISGESLEVFRYDADNITAIMHLPAISITSSGFEMVFPGFSVTLLVVENG